MKRLLVALLLLVPSLGHAQRYVEQRNAVIAYNYDLTATSYTYCKYTGTTSGDPFGTPIPGPRLIKTSGSSTTVTSATSGDNAFAEVAVGDLLFIAGTGTTAPSLRAVTARASADSITVDTAITLAGNTWSWMKLSCGATITDGWIPVGLFGTVTFSTEWATKNATSLESQVECRVGIVTASPTIINTTSLSAVGNNTVVISDGAYDSCRLGLKLTTDTGAQSVSAFMAVKR